jgi:hypothetical protein
MSRHTRLQRGAVCAFALVCLLFVCKSALALPADSTYPMAINWMTLDRRLDGGNLRHWWDDSLKFNVYHIDMPWGHDSSGHYVIDTSFNWVRDGSNSRFIVSDETLQKDGTRIPDSIARFSTSITRFSIASKMVYTPLSKPGMAGDTNLTDDTLTHTYFITRDTTFGHPYPNNPDRGVQVAWQVDSSSHTDVKILDSSEVLDGQNVWQRMFEDDTTSYWRVGAKVQVLKVDTSDTNTKPLFVIWTRMTRSLWTAPEAHLFANDHVILDTVVHRDTIFWRDIRDTNWHVWFAGSTFNFPKKLRFIDGSDTVCDVHVEVRSARWVTMRIYWVSIQNLDADSLLSGLPLEGCDENQEYPHLDSISKFTIKRRIDSCARYVRDAFKVHPTDPDSTSRLWKFYEKDECQSGELLAQGRVNEILSSLGETERDVYQMRRYLEIAKPLTMRVGAWNTGNWGTGVTPYFDHGMGEGFVDCWPDSASANGFFRSQGHMDYGYFPYRSGAYVTPSQYALMNDTTLTLASGSNCGDPTRKTDYSFDIVDWSTVNSHPERRGGQDVWRSAVVADSLVYLNSVPGNQTKEWWANIFMDGVVMRKKSDSAYGGFYGGISSPVPEQLSLASNIAIATGGKALFYWIAVPVKYDDSWQLGFTDTLGLHQSDSNYYVGNKIPTMCLRNNKWARNYRQFLFDYGKLLYRARWLGASIRRGTATATADEQTIGTNPLVSLARDSMTRPIINHWPSSSSDTSVHVYATKVPDAARFVTYGYFQEDTVTPGYLLFVCNNAIDPRDVFCAWRTNADSAINHLYVMRGEREIYTGLNCDSNIATFWRVIRVDTTHPDTSVIAWNGSFHRHYVPGGSHIFRIEPYCDYADRNPIDTLGVWTNGAVHMVRHADEYRTVYVRGGTVYTRKMSDCAVAAEQVVDTGGVVPFPWGGLLMCSYPHYPSLARPDTSPGSPHIEAMITDRYFIVNRTAAIAQHRGGAADEDLIVWEQNVWDTTFNVLMNNTTVTFHKAILGRTISFSGDTFLTRDPFVIAGDVEIPQRLSVWTAPSVCGTDSGWIIAYSDSSAYIRFAVIQGHGGSYMHNQFGDAVTADSLMQGALFPSIAWGSDIATGIPGFVPLAQVVWQQYSTRSSKTEIYHQVIEVHFDTAGCPFVGIVPSTLPCEQVSHPNDPWNCGNYMPSITVDNLNGNYSPPRPLNVGHISWHSVITHPGLREGRVTYYAWPGVVGSQGYWSGFASGTEDFEEPGIYISPSDTDIQTLVLSFAGSSDTMRSYVEGDTVLRAYKDKGHHPTLSYSLGMDYAPSTVFELTSPSHHAGVLKAPVGSTVAASRMPRSGEVHSVVLSPRSSPWGYHTCGLRGIIASIGLPATGIGANQFKPFGRAHAYAGNGTEENQAVATRCFVLELGIPFVMPRTLAARDSVALQHLIATGNHPKALIELVDSATGAVLTVLDSIVVASRHDTLNHTGDLMYMPDEDFVGFPVYVRARIIADTNVAAWNIDKLTTFGWEGYGGPAKQAFHYAGRAGWVPVGANPIDLTIYPSPARPRSRVMYTVPVEDAGDITEVRVYGIMGQDVSTLVHDVKPAGRYAVEFNGADLRAGQYVVAVHTSTHVQSRLITVMK